MPSPFVAAHSTKPDTSAAIAEVLARIDREARFVLLYAGARHDLGAIARHAKAHAPGAAIVGASTSGEIAADGAHDHAITALAAASEAVHAVAAHATGITDSPERAAEELAERLVRTALPQSEHRVLLVHAPGFTVRESGWEQRALPVLQQRLGSDLLLVGGSAGDDLRFLGSRVHEGGVAMDDAIVGLLIATDRPVVASLQHGYRGTGRTARVTRSHGTRLEELDGQRATRRYAELVGISEKELAKGSSMVKLGGWLPTRFTAIGQSFGMTPQKMLDTLPFYQHTVRHPLGRPISAGRAGSPAVLQPTFPRLATPDGALELFVGIPEGTEVELLARDETAFLRAAHDAIEHGRVALGAAPAACLLIECAGRKMVLGERLGESLELLRGEPCPALAGFYSHGEQGPASNGQLACCNYSVVALCFG